MNTIEKLQEFGKLRELVKNDMNYCWVGDMRNGTFKARKQDGTYVTFRMD